MYTQYIPKEFRLFHVDVCKPLRVQLDSLYKLEYY